MDSRDVLTLLAYCNELDGRHAPNELKVAAWRDLFAAEAPGLTLEFARDVARRHYAKQDVMLSPSVFVREWRQSQTSRALGGLAGEAHDRHCRRAHCQCTHAEPCYRGWLDREDNTATAPCPTCRRELAHLVAMIPPPGMRNPSDWVVPDDVWK